VKNLLLLIITPADLKALPAAIEAIKTSNIRGVWTLVNPSIVVDQKVAAEAFDKDIADLTVAEQSAAQRGDYDGAKQYLAQRNGKILDRAKALRDAWSKIPKEERDDFIKNNIARPMLDALNPLRDDTGIALKHHDLTDHWEPENWIAMLNSITGGWFKPFAPGTFFVAWPGVVAAVLKNAEATFRETAKAETFIETPIKETVKTAAAVHQWSSRREELENTARSIRVSIAAKLGVEGAPKMTGPELTEAILATEAKKTAVTEPALNEY